jgi:hypothetical protein
MFFVNAIKAWLAIPEMTPRKRALDLGRSKSDKQRDLKIGASM